MTLESLIIAEAREWIGTRFVHQGRCKRTVTHKGGCDCIGLIIGVMKHCDIVSDKQDTFGKRLRLHEFDQTDYSLLPDGRRLKAALMEYLDPIPTDRIRPADILLFRFDQNPQHVAFTADYGGGEGELSLIHCYRSAGAVVEHRFDESWRERLVGAFRIRTT